MVNKIIGNLEWTSSGGLTNESSSSSLDVNKINDKNKLDFNKKC